MAPAKNESAKKSKKLLRKEVSVTLSAVFPDIKEAVGEKKFDKKVKKASRVLAAGALSKQTEKTLTKKKAKDTGKTSKPATPIQSVKKEPKEAKAGGKKNKQSKKAESTTSNAEGINEVNA